jgi:hypothetical protein
MHAETQSTWLLWNESTAITAATDTIVSPWQHTQAATAATVQFYWNSWVGAQERTAEQRADDRRQRALIAERDRNYAAVRKAAAERAEKLLEACLTSGQRDQLKKNGWFVVHSKSGRAYQIRRGRARNIVEVNTRRTYCCHPIDNVPDADTMLAQKLMIESAEEDFLRLANVS